MKSRLAKRANKSQSEYVNIGEKDPEERKGTADENLQLFEKRDAGDLEFFPGEKEEVIALSSSFFFFSRFDDGRTKAFDSIDPPWPLFHTFRTPARRVRSGSISIFSD